MTQHLLGILFLLVGIALFGCATATPIVGPDGTTNQLISCGEIEQCYQKAREVCGGRYSIVNTSSNTSGINGTTGTTTNLLVKCGR